MCGYELNIFLVAIIVLYIIFVCIALKIFSKVTFSNLKKNLFVLLSMNHFSILFSGEKFKSYNEF